jgi:EPS-associated MarR family transcriptional regulator
MNESQFNTLRELAKDSTLSQRDLSQKMGLSLGRVNYIVNALLEMGYIKAERFKNSKNKMGYMYVLTPRGIAEKFRQTQTFLLRKTDEYERLKQEIELLRIEDALTRKRVNVFHDHE